MKAIGFAGLARATALGWIAASLVSAANAFEPKVEKAQFDSHPQNIVYFQDSSVVLFHGTDDLGTVLRSADDGSTWKPIDLPGDKLIVKSVIEHPFDPNVAYALSAADRHFVTTNRGESWKEFKVPVTALFGLPPLTFNSAKPDYVIATGITCPDGKPDSEQCHTEVYYTKDNFASKPSKLMQDASKCLWGRTTPESNGDISEDSIICQLQVDRTSKLAVSTDFFRSSQPVEVDGKPITDVLDFGGMSQFFIAATQFETQDPQEVRLFTSVDLKTWRLAKFPGDESITETSFTILESSKHSLHVDVLTDTHSADWGTMYVSNSDGAYFSKSLEGTSRSSDGLIDIETLEGIEGVLIANTRDKSNSDWVQSRMSYDDGRSWHPLKLTEDECKSKEDCNVHLHAVLDHRNVGRIFSSPSPGIIAGIGNTGENLLSRDEGDLYLSHDSGRTWSLALMSPHFYEFGDQGNVIVAISDRATDELRYSIDRGATWTNYRFGTKIKPTYLLTTPDSTSMKFLLFGMVDGKLGSMTFDFTGLHDKKCVMKEDGSGDMEKWYALYGDNDEPQCIMGHKQYFWRKKESVECYVGDLYHEQFASTEDCSCSDTDYECAANFLPDSNGKCVPNSEYKKELNQCTKGEKFTRPSGYSLVPGNTCKKDSNSVNKDGDVEVICGEEVSDSPSTDGKVKSYRELFDGEIEHYFYLKNDDESPDEETLVVRTSYDRAFVSHDHGSSWDQILKDEEILILMPNPHFPSALFAITAEGKFYYSTDRGKNFLKSELPGSPGGWVVVDFHPDKIDWIIFVGQENCSNPFACQISGFYTKSGGKDWKLLQEGVQKCSWVGHLIETTEEELIFCDRFDDSKTNHELVSSTDFFKSEKVHFDAIIGYALEHEYLIVAKVADNGADLQALVSVDGKKFAHAQFPHDFQVRHQQAYTILESSTKAVFLHITVNDKQRSEYGTILKSNSNGTDYVVSLPYVNRDALGFVDFEKMYQLEGVALSNVVSNVDEVNSGSRKKLKTMITHNDGAAWSYITPPTEGSDGKHFDCSGQSLDKCSLNLHGYTEREDYRDSYSSESAVGLMVAVGNVGEFLSDKKDGNTYLTRDGGINWKEVRKGEYMWEYGDSGSIIVLVNGFDSTNVLYYSLDEGATWEEYKFSEDLVHVDDIATVPSDTSRKFVLFGRPPAREGAKAFAIQVDFSGLTDRQCVLDPADGKDTDFEMWTPAHPLSKERCLFGHEAVYHRKIPGNNCYIGWRPNADLHRPHEVIRNCACTREDFECDFNYHRAADGTCQLVPGYQPPDHQAVCKEMPGTVEYWEPTGYRRIPMSSCEGGNEYDKVDSHPCPGQEGEYERKHRGLHGFALFIVIMLPIGMALVIGFILWDHFSKRYGQIRLGEEDLDQNIVVRYLVIGVAAIVAVVSVIPSMARSVYDRIASRFGRSTLYTTRGSFSRSNQQYLPVDIEEDGELLQGDDFDDDVDELDGDLSP